MMSSRTYSGLLCTVGGCPTNKFSSRCEHSTVTQIGLGPATKRAEEHGVNLKAKLYAGGWKPLSLGMLVLYPRKVSRVINPYGWVYTLRGSGRSLPKPKICPQTTTVSVTI